MSARWWTSLIWALVAGSGLYWGFQLFVKSPPPPAGTVVVLPSAGARGDLARLFGADAPPVVAAAEAVAADNRFQLVGVLSPRSQQAQREGVALIAVDGAPPKAYRVGAVVEGDTVLQSVRARAATLGPRDGAASTTLELAPPAAPATGSLPPAMQADGGPMRRPNMSPPVPQPNQQPPDGSMPLR